MLHYLIYHFGPIGTGFLSLAAFLNLVSMLIYIRRFRLGFGPSGITGVPEIIYLLCVIFSRGTPLWRLSAVLCIAGFDWLTHCVISVSRVHYERVRSERGQADTLLSNASSGSPSALRDDSKRRPDAANGDARPNVS